MCQGARRPTCQAVHAPAPQTLRHVAHAMQCSTLSSLLVEACLWGMPLLTVHMLAQECGEVCQPITNAVRVGTELNLVGHTTPDAAGHTTSS